VRHVILPFWNAYYFLTLYANAANTTGTIRTDQTDVLDRYLLGEVRRLIDSVTNQLDSYDIFAACESVSSFLDTLTNWYIRRSRDRFWHGDQDAVDTLHTALVTLCQVAAPMLPFVTEEISAGLLGAGAGSVHLTDWPDASRFERDDDLSAGMAQVRDACSALLSLRKSQGLRVRLPLTSATLAVADPTLVAPHLDILRDELNVKRVELTTDLDRFGTKELVLNPKTLGPRLGKQVQDVIRAHKAGDWNVVGDIAIVGGVELLAGEFEFKIVSVGDAAVATLRDGAGMVSLDTLVTDDLEVEGRARDLIRLVQLARREADLHVSDRITLHITAPAATLAAFEAHQELVLRETLGVSAATTEGTEIVISVKRAN